ncbi:MAG: Hsp20/alpha crystallin family protein [Minisyncoccia bacterium]
MSLIQWSPFRDLERFFEDDDWFLPVVSASFFKEPAMDLYQTDNEVIAELNLPNIDPEKVEVSVKDQVLKIKGSTEGKEEEKKKNYWRKEIRRGEFERLVRIPVEIDEDKVEAHYEKGILKVIMPKKSPSHSEEKKIKIKTKD